jgi:hypothetical protein
MKTNKSGEYFVHEEQRGDELRMWGYISRNSVGNFSVFRTNTRCGDKKHKFINEYETPWRIMVEERGEYCKRIL